MTALLLWTTNSSQSLFFLDLGKAFDTVNKDIMLTKLHRYGFRDIMNDFFRSYLSDRRMYVCVNGKNLRLERLT